MFETRLWYYVPHVAFILGLLATGLWLTLAFEVRGSFASPCGTLSHPPLTSVRGVVLAFLAAQ